jgi:phage baseplate assembly protein W
MSNRLFTGFSTQDSDKTRQRTFYDLELCKRDLMNHFHTRPGERVMRPEWGCGIWDYLMEPLTEGIKDTITDMATAVVDADARCQTLSVDVVETRHGFTINISINFLPQAVVDSFAVDFDRRSSEM